MVSIADGVDVDSILGNMPLVRGWWWEDILDPVLFRRNVSFWKTGGMGFGEVVGWVGGFGDGYVGPFLIDLEMGAS